MVVDKNFGNLIMGFILILVGVILFVQLADNIFAAVTLTSITNESLAITSTPNTVINETITIASGVGNTSIISVINITFFGNGTVNTDNPLFNISTEVNWTIDGVVTVTTINFSNGNYNISYIYTTDGTGDTANEDVAAVSFFGSPAINTDMSTISFDAEVNFTKPGVISVNTLNFTDASYNISYTYEGTEYVVDSSSRTILPLTNIFFALAVFLVGVGLAFTSLKGMGVL